MNIDEAMKLPFLDNVIGNAAAYTVVLGQVPEAYKWSDEDWTNIRLAYYVIVTHPGSAWLHDIYKNLCRYDVHKTYEFLHKLYLATV